MFEGNQFDIIDLFVVIQTITQMQNNSQLDEISNKMDILIKEVQNARNPRNDEQDS